MHKMFIIVISIIAQPKYPTMGKHLSDLLYNHWKVKKKKKERKKRRCNNKRNA